jgi:hypothetical protein
LVPSCPEGEIQDLNNSIDVLTFEPVGSGKSPTFWGWNSCHENIMKISSMGDLQDPKMEVR